MEELTVLTAKQLHLVVTWAEKDDILGGTDLQSSFGH